MGGGDLFFVLCIFFALLGGGQHFGILPRHGPFGDSHYTKALSGAASPLYGLGHLLYIVGDFGDQNYICPTGNTGAKGQPAGVVAHNFNHNNPVMAVGGGVKPINRLNYGEQVTVIGTIWQTRAKRMKGNQTLIQAVVNDGTGSIQATWFNQPWITKTLKAGARIVLAGKVEQYLGRFVLNNPEWELLPYMPFSWGGNSFVVESRAISGVPV